MTINGVRMRQGEWIQRVPEALLVGLGGMAISGGSVWLLVPVLRGTPFGLALLIGAASAGALNGYFCGYHRVYAWRRFSGWMSFFVDSTWNLLGICLADLLHVTCPLTSAGRFRRDLSQRRNRLIYEDSFGLGGIALSPGNIVRIMPTEAIAAPLVAELVDHETSHLHQQRIFGPILMLTFLVWLIVGSLVGLLLGLRIRQPLAQSIMDIAYYNNPWETWAYRAHGPFKGQHHGGRLSWS